MFKAAIYQFLECSTHGLKPQEPFLFLQMILVALHGSSFHRAAVYISNSVERIVILPKRNIPPDINMLFRFMGSPAQKNQDTAAA